MERRKSTFLRKLVSWPWAQAGLWIFGLSFLLFGAGNEYGTNWGVLIVGAVLIAAALALAFLRLQRRRMERSGSHEEAPLEDPVSSAGPPASGPPVGPASGPPIPSRTVGPASAPPIPSVIADEMPTKPWWRGPLNFVIFVIVAVCVRSVLSLNHQRNVPSGMTDAQIVERLEAQVAATPGFAPTYQRMKTDFPEDYAALLRGVVPIARAGGGRDEGFLYGERFMRDFFQRQAPLVRHADAHSLALLLDVEAQFMNELASNNAEACAYAFEHGEVTPASGAAIAPSSGATLNAVNLAMFDAIRSGRLSPVEHAPVTDREWTTIAERSILLGAEREVLAAWGQPGSERFSATQKCEAGRAMFNAMTEEPDEELKARYAVELFAAEQP